MLGTTTTLGTKGVVGIGARASSSDVTEGTMGPSLADKGVLVSFRVDLEASIFSRASLVEE